MPTVEEPVRTGEKNPRRIPIFRGYVFVYCTEEAIASIQKHPRPRGMAYLRGTISGEEIQIIQNQAAQRIQNPVRKNLNPEDFVGRTVLIIGGRFKECQGNVTRQDNGRLMVDIRVWGHITPAKISPSYLQIIP